MKTPRYYVGGSDVARILGVSPYGGPVALWREKTGRDAPRPSSALLRAGLHMESWILREYEATGAVLRVGHETPDGEVWAQQTAWHPRYPWAGGTIDSFADREGRRVVVDAKCSRRVVDEGDPETIPWEWALQLHHYGWICGIDRGEIALCRVGGDWSVVAVPLDLDLDWYEASIVPRLAEFWACVEGNREPPPVAFVERDPPPQLGPEAESAARRYALAAKREAEAEAAKKEARDELRRAILDAGNPKLAMAGSARVASWPIAGRESLHVAALRHDLPDIADRYTRRGEPSQGLRVTLPGERT